MEKAGLIIEDIDFLVPHQANIRMIDSAVKRLVVSHDKVGVNLNRYGNMSAASIPVALDELVENEKIKAGDHLLFVGFGLTWGASVLRWNTR
ncbi:hypothetical protein GCM10011571_35540 [Marinithermofilum abyssi]|uniref:Beta-ketoacyl-[acyl-carrier-protein] synthase III C-terminal domain-containing protein n=1 Tax=Marinithermofilum abyssi TaxID=1571185 RepID=A0A8J2VMF5_9BACL|nr:hypothetical protein GCM10011571_35540 [Marinithermofilum abyssi]